MKLWCHVIDAAGDDETIGERATGQQTFAVSEDTSGPTRLAEPRDTTKNTFGRVRQATLTGGVIGARDTDTEREMREPWKKDPTWRAPTAKEKAAQHPAQKPLSAWTREDGIDPTQWDVGPASPSAGIRFAD